MSNLEDRLLNSSTGEHRLHPDEQRRYLGTYAERVALTILVEDARNDQVTQHFPSILEELNHHYQPLKVKISPTLSDRLQLVYMKTSKNLGIPSCIVEELKSQTPFGIVVFSDHPINVEKQDIHERYPELFESPIKTNDEKIPFWKKLFH